MTESNKETDYALEGNASQAKIEAPRLNYGPPRPKAYRPRIGLIGCGGITETHLQACRWHRFPVTLFCDHSPAKAAMRRDRFYPKADVVGDYRRIIESPDIDIIDIATHPQQRETVLKEAIAAGKHILSQKPFVLDLKLGRNLVDLAHKQGVRLAVNHNGRWAPHFSYMRQAINQGVIGDVTSVDLSVHWDHNFVHTLPFNKIPYLILYDFGIHWFDILHCFMGNRVPRRVWACVKKVEGQKAYPPLLANVTVEYENAMASIILNGNTLTGSEDRTIICGTAGTLKSVGPSIGKQSVTLHTAKGIAKPRLSGTWFTSGFRGTIGELACAVEENREPANAARDSLHGLQLAFAAMQSASTGKPVDPATVTKVRSGWLVPEESTYVGPR